MFVGEVEKSVQLLDLFVGDYDVVVSNPPYLGSGKMEDTLKQYVKNNYKGSRDLYTAFIERCTELANNDDYVTMVTPESFMFLYSYRGLRKELVSNVQIIEGAHVSRYGFDQAKDSYTIPFVLRNSNPRNFTSSRFDRMTHEQEEYAHYEDKISGLIEITEHNRRSDDHPDVYTVDQNTFLDIGRTPFVYWFGSEILDLFRNYPNLGEAATVKHGLRTGDDDRFVRKYWEPQPDVLEEEYVPFQKSGTDAPYYDIPTDFLLWGNDGKEVSEYDGSDASNKNFFFNDGVTYRSYGNYFVARRKDTETVFSHKAHFVSSKNHSHDVLTGVLSSSLIRFIMNGINPGLGFEVGDGKRIPIKKNISNKTEIEGLVTTAIDKRKTLSSLQEESYDYSGDNFYGRV
jgi:hypothetical protein